MRLIGAFVVATSVGFMISASAAEAGDASGYVRRASCTLVRYYVAKYSAPAAEAWARSKGATDAEINTARRCITPQNTAQVGRTDRAFDPMRLNISTRSGSLCCPFNRSAMVDSSLLTNHWRRRAMQHDFGDGSAGSR